MTVKNKLERMVPANDFCAMAAEIAVRDFKPVDWETIDDIPEDDPRLLAISAYLNRCIMSGMLPARRWPLFGIEPPPLAKSFVYHRPAPAPIEGRFLMVAISDFREWIKTSKVAAPETWADALSDSILWCAQPIEGTNVVTGSAKGRPRMLPGNVQDEANKIALELYRLNGKMPQRKTVAVKLAGRYCVQWSTVKDRFSVRECRNHITITASKQ